MQYFVTGATGFIGKRLVKKLLERKGAVVHFLIRKESADKDRLGMECRFLSARYVSHDCSSFFGK